MLKSAHEKHVELVQKAQAYFRTQGIILQQQYPVDSIGSRTFDLGNDTVLVRCRAFDWLTKSKNDVPPAKITHLLEDIASFKEAPLRFSRKILLLKRAYSEKRKVTLGGYFINKYPIPEDIEIWECAINESEPQRIK
jgi:hypothetical protein